MARLREICPPGIWCLTPSVGFLFIFVILLLIGGLLYLNKPFEIQRQIQPPINITNVTDGSDDRYSMAPRPERNWMVGPDLRGALIAPGSRPINIPTQGLPESYQSMGLLKTSDGAMLPLYGRRVASRSDRFNYYTRTDTYNPVPLPIRFKRRDCQDNVGCEELFNGEHVTIVPTKQEATATMYQFDGPTYIPGIV